MNDAINDSINDTMNDTLDTAAAANPLLELGALPPFGRIRPQDVEPAVRLTLQRNRERIGELQRVTAPSFATLVEPLEELQHSLARVWSPVSHLNAVANSEPLRASYNACLPMLSEYQTDLSQSESLFRAYSAFAEREAVRLSPDQRRVLEHALRDFRLAGVALGAEARGRFKAIMVELAQLAAKFDENVLDCMNAWQHRVEDAAELAGLGEGIVAPARARAAEAGLNGWILHLDQPTYVSVMTDGESQALRRLFYEAWSTRASELAAGGRWDNTPVIEQLLRLKHEVANLLGFPAYADLALATRMARSSSEVISFLRALAQAARPAAEREYQQLQAFAGQPLEPWDVSYWSERLRRDRYAVSQEALRPWFPLPGVLAGLFEVAQRLFAIQISERTDVETWHESVRYFEISRAAGDSGKAIVGAFFLDPHARPKKRNGAWMDECVGRKVLGSGAALPVAHLVCNFLPPTGDRPALLTHDEVVTLFHEFGHGLHHLLTRVDYPSIAGINGVAWDAVELPSQFLENYAWHPEVLSRISGHVDTGLPLPAELQSQLIASRSFHAGLATLRQVEFALFDFRLHSEYRPDSGARLTQLAEQVRDEVAVIRPPHWNRFALSFSHIFAGGYAAGYYSYKWAEVLAADAFAAFEERGVFDRATAQRFQDSILSRGGSRDALDAFIEFRGRKPEIEALLRQHGILEQGTRA